MAAAVTGEWLKSAHCVKGQRLSVYLAEQQLQMQHLNVFSERLKETSSSAVSPMPWFRLCWIKAIEYVGCDVRRFISGVLIQVKAAGRNTISPPVYAHCSLLMPHASL